MFIETRKPLASMDQIVPVREAVRTTSTQMSLEEKRPSPLSKM